MAKVENEQIKIAIETDYGVIPDPSTDPNTKNIYSFTGKFNSGDPKRNMIEVKSNTSTFPIDTLPGAVSNDGGFDIFLRTETIPFMMNLLFDTSTDVNILGKVDSDGDGEYDSSDVVMKQYVYTTSAAMMQSFTISHYKVDPAREVMFYTGCIMTSATLNFDITSALTLSVQFTGRQYEDELDVDSVNSEFTSFVPVKSDFLRGLDFAIYTDLRSIPIDDFGQNLPAGYEIIDVIYGGQTEQITLDNGTTVSVSKVDYVLIGRRLSDIKTATVTFTPTTNSNDANIAGTVFSSEIAMRTIENWDISLDFTTYYTVDEDPITGKKTSKILDVFLAGAKDDTSLKFTETGLGRLSVVLKFAAWNDIKPYITTVTSGDYTVDTSILNETNPLKFETAEIRYPVDNVGGSINRGFFIFPKLIIQNVTKSVDKRLMTIKVTAKANRDDIDGPLNMNVLGSSSLQLTGQPIALIWHTNLV